MMMISIVVPIMMVVLIVIQMILRSFIDHRGGRVLSDLVVRSLRIILPLGKLYQLGYLDLIRGGGVISDDSTNGAVILFAFTQKIFPKIRIEYVRGRFDIKIT